MEYLDRDTFSSQLIGCCGFPVVVVVLWRCCCCCCCCCLVLLLLLLFGGGGGGSVFFTPVRLPQSDDSSGKVYNTGCLRNAGRMGGGGGRGVPVCACS